MIRHTSSRPPLSSMTAIWSLLAIPLLLCWPLAAMASTPDSFADLAEKLGPTVVNIYTTQTVKVSSTPFMTPEFDDIPEPFRRFFGVPERHPQQKKQRDLQKTSLGSGVITSSDGYILTNNHVVEDADEINVKLSTFEEYEAKIIGRDPKSDLALIKIEPKTDLAYATFGDSEKLRVGDWVVAIGNPFGLEQTVTAGIVSAKGRSISNETYGNFIQTDASINPGNSGGPLFDMNGKMVGVNTAIFSRSGGNIGIGFAIPVNMVQNVLSQLKENGKVARGWLGVMIQHVTPELASNFDLERPIGALVGNVSPGSPADKAGIKQGDVIISYQGKEISQMSMLPAMVAQSTVGEKAKIVVIRDGHKKEILVTIGQLEEDDATFGALPEDLGHDLGLTVQELTKELADTLGLKGKSGLLVSDVEPASPAALAGIRRGDLLLEINRTPVSDKESLKNALKEAGKKTSILFLLQREEHTLYAVLKKKDD